MNALPAAALVLRLLVGAVFLLAVLGKLRAPARFRANLTESMGVPPALGMALTPAVILAEAALALMLLGDVQARTFAMPAALVLLIGFTCFVAYKYVTADSVRCSCFGEAERPLSVYDLLRNGLLIGAIACWLYWPAPPAQWTPAQLALASAAALVLAVGLSRLHEMIVRFRVARAPQAPALGEHVAAVMGRMLDDGRPEMLPGVEQAVALLFLSSRCPSCRGKLPEIAGLLAPAVEAGLKIRLVSAEPAWRLRRFLAGDALRAITVRVGGRRYARLNPAMQAPYYLFIGPSGDLQAAGLIGDDDWLSLRAQLEEVALA
ncbi:MauE/DoxX family redox-associated membrane protein [Rugamonas rivuli]|uniref:Methylamine utilization protein MauE n=1 Tax=Rugamonas rivuli TaxID=2743358 RepID=A0A843S8I2_9BURK|nr:MauE/DoxX family redox-associated membrane protein [Rugamonas rivuli]MQA18768.1 DoxX family membrane protein [Rugamonas rivuli]